MKNLRFWQKTYLLTLLLFLVALFGGIIFIGWQNQQQMMNREMEKAKSEQHFIAQNLSRDLSTIQSNIHLRIPALARSYGQYYTQDDVLLEVRADGETLFSNLPASSEEYSDLKTEEGAQSWTVQEFGGTQYSIVASPLTGEFENYTLTCARSLAPLTETWTQMRSTLAIGSILVSVLVAIGLFFVLRGISKPLEKLAGVADEFASGDFSARAVRRGNDEIGILAGSLNAMADTAVQNITEIQTVADQNARMAANLSHEIRTPLTAIQGYAEYMHLAELTPEEQEASLRYIIEESTRLQKISERMLQLSALEHEEIAKEPLELAEIIRLTIQSIRPKAEQAGVVLSVSPVPDVQILGDDILLESLLTNLLDNAVKSCSANGKVQLETEQADKTATIIITDNGCGMEREELNKIGEPFYRPDKSRSRKEGGAGLGVALCRQIATLHGTELQYKSALDKGTAVMLKFTTL